MSLHAGYPRTFAEIERWATSSGRTVIEARLRFAQFGVLLAISRSRALSPLLVFKGGNALDFVWQPNRSTRDLDFSADGALEEPMLAKRLASALESVERSHNVSNLLHRIERQPPGDDKSSIGCQSLHDFVRTTVWREKRQNVERPLQFSADAWHRHRYGRRTAPRNA